MLVSMTLHADHSVAPDYKQVEVLVTVQEGGQEGIGPDSNVYINSFEQMPSRVLATRCRASCARCDEYSTPEISALRIHHAVRPEARQVVGSVSSTRTMNSPSRTLVNTTIPSPKNG